MRIAVLLSGGVDSSVALSLLRDRGHDVTAFYLKIWLEEELAFLGDCPWEEDLKYARAVCNELDVPLEIVPLQSEYLDTVVSFALDELKAGRTPSPDIMCNRRIKFGELGTRIDSSYEKVASGHYAQIGEEDGLFTLLRSPDPVKDQTYFLSGITQDQLARALFPIGSLMKAQVRDKAAKLDLPNRDRKDSQGICFLGKISYSDFVKAHLGKQEGEIVELETRKALGRHSGYWFYTIGQRGGLGLGQGPWYVVRKDTKDNVVYVSHKDARDARSRDSFEVRDINWSSGRPDETRLQVKVRHGPESTPCHVSEIDSGLKVEMDKSDPGIAPGQSAVFYDGERCLGGGLIR